PSKCPCSCAGSSSSSACSRWRGFRGPTTQCSSTRPSGARPHTAFGSASEARTRTSSNRWGARTWQPSARSSHERRTDSSLGSARDECAFLVLALGCAEQLHLQRGRVSAHGGAAKVPPVSGERALRGWTVDALAAGWNRSHGGAEAQRVPGLGKNSAGKPHL